MRRVREEPESRRKHDAPALRDRMKAEGIRSVVNPVRRNAVSGNAFYGEGLDGVTNGARRRLEPVREKELPAEEINALPHMAICPRPGGGRGGRAERMVRPAQGGSLGR